MTRVVSIEVDDLNGNKANVALPIESGAAVPVTHLDRRQALALRVLAWEDDPVREVCRRVEAEVSSYIDLDWGIHVQETHALIEKALGTEAAGPRQDLLVKAAANLFHAIDRLDEEVRAQAPVEVRRDDLLYLLTTEFDGSEEVQVDRLRRLRDAAGLNGATEEAPGRNLIEATPDWHR